MTTAAPLATVAASAKVNVSDADFVNVLISAAILVLLICVLQVLSKLGLFDHLQVQHEQVDKFLLAAAAMGPDPQWEKFPGPSEAMADIATIAAGHGVTDETPEILLNTQESDNKQVPDTASTTQINGDIAQRGQLLGVFKWSLSEETKKSAENQDGSWHGVVVEHGGRANQDNLSAWSQRLSKYSSIEVQLTEKIHFIVLRAPERTGIAHKFLTWRALRRLRAHLKKSRRQPCPHCSNIEYSDSSRSLWLFTSPRQKVIIYAIPLHPRDFRATPMQRTETNLSQSEASVASSGFSTISSQSMRHRR